MLRFVIAFDAGFQMGAEAGDVHAGFFIDGNVDKVVGAKTRYGYIFVSETVAGND
jgi:hypothetical protein